MTRTEAAIEIVYAVAAAIKELKEVPSGHLYAHLMGQMSLEDYNKILHVLENSRLIKIAPSHMITWIG